MKTVSEIRQTFLDFFASKGHTIVPSSPLVPGNDPTLLFTNSGMVQFKDVFLGAEKRSYVRAASSQRCVRAGGKHNDLDSVGYTARHHTFFEMLGNFSFGDYFKRDAIVFAWELLTGVYGLPADKLWVTVYHTDDEAYDLWANAVGVPHERIVRIGDNKGAPFASDNFWQMADTGPCGPCTEIFYDHGPGIAGGPPGSPEEDGDRYIEIWNLVFMQFDRSADGKLSPLPAPCVDTGMGLERLSAVLQHVHANYEIDLFQRLIEAAGKLTGTTNLEEKSLRVIADHIRACAFLIVDGVLPSNEGRGYVLRRIIRRALRHGWKLGTRELFFHRMVAPLVAEMGRAYPELAQKEAMVTQALKGEEERFAETLERGMRVLELALRPERRAFALLESRFGGPPVAGPGSVPTASDRERLFGTFRTPKGQVMVEVLASEGEGQTIADVNGWAKQLAQRAATADYHALFLEVLSQDPSQAEQDARIRVEAQAPSNFELEFVDHRQLPVDGRSAFVLYDTYGFPVDLTADVARERGLVVDMAGFESAMEAQRGQARSASKFTAQGTLSADVIKTLPATQFTGYDGLATDGARVVAILKDGDAVDAANDGDSVVVILDRTPFYAESGGQVGDRGELAGASGTLDVVDTTKLAGTFHGHVGRWKGGVLRVGDTVSARVDAARRQSTVLNHSATHLLHAALREVLGDHVQQKGSLVAPDRLRFDFSHFEPVKPDQLAKIEALVNREIRANAAADVRNMAYKDALDFGAVALFGEKYGEHVRVMKFGEFSTELCGGTHVGRTGDIGLFKIVSEGGVASGVRRIEAVTGEGALAWYAEREKTLGELGRLLGTGGDEAIDKLKQVLERQKRLERELESLKAKATGSALDGALASAQDVGGFKVLAMRLPGADAKTLRDSVDLAKQKLKDCVVLLASASDGKVALVAGVAGTALAKVKAGDLLSHVAGQIGGKGGGRADMAQGGGEDSPRVDQVLAHVPEWVSARVV